VKGANRLVALIEHPSDGPRPEVEISERRRLRPVDREGG
jgi:hypothetical protein